MAIKIADLSQEQVRQYFLSRLPNIKPVTSQVLCCPFHPDRTASFSLNLDKAAWFCHSGCGSGGLIDFEMKFSGIADRQAAAVEIFRAIGLETSGAMFSGPTEKPEATYQYRDELGKLLFEKLRFPGKNFRQRRPLEGGKWEYRLGDIRKPLYNLPEVITANCVIVCEGEKDCDRVNSLKLSEADVVKKSRVIATTNFDGAGKWNPKDSALFAGKQVVILPDNDPIGQKHAEMVATAVQPYAHSVKVLQLPDLPAKGDVSDYLDGHPAGDLLKAIQAAPLYEQPISSLLVNATQFDRSYTPEIEWLVQGVIQKGANGFVCAAPKSGKSWITAELAISLAVGKPWMGFDIPSERKVAVISREDNPALTKWRMRQLIRTRGYDLATLGEQLWVNSKDQSPQFRLDNPEHLSEMIAALQKVQPSLIILDVLNVLHGADENDNTEMRKVLDQLNVIHREVGASLCVVHHFNKATGGSLTNRLRGSSAIAGWAEFIIGIDGDEVPRKLLFELKAATPPEPFSFSIRSDGPCTYIEKVPDLPPEPLKRNRVSEILQ